MARLAQTSTSRRSSPTRRPRSSASSATATRRPRGVYEMCRYHLGLDGAGAPAGKRMRPLLGPARLRLDRRRPPARAARRRGGRARPQLQPRPRRHRGRRSRAAPPPDALGDARHPAGDQHRRHAVQPQPDRAPPPDRARLPRRARCSASCASTTRPASRCARASTSTSGRAEHDEPMSVELYFDMIGRKTAALIAASIEAGAAARHRRRGGHRPLPRLRLGARASPSSSTTTCSGSGAQERATGKEPTDVARKKKTLPVIYAFEHAPARRPRPPRGALRRRPTRRPRDVAEIVAILERTGAREFTRDEARRHRDGALAELDAAGVVDARAARAPRADHPLRDQRLAALPRQSLHRRSRTSRRLNTVPRRPVAGRPGHRARSCGTASRPHRRALRR